MKTFFPILALLLSMSWSACNKPANEAPVVEFQLGNSFELALGQQGDCGCGGLSITFEKVLEDSRCPIGLDCVWIGQVKVRLKIKTSTEERIFEPSYSAIQSSLPSENIGKYSVLFLDLSPYPAGDNAIRDEDYRVSLMVSTL